MPLHEAFDGTVIKDESGEQQDVIKHPWGLSSLYGYQFFCCPECEFKVHEKQTFVNHAYTDHPDSIDYLSSINDNSLEDVTFPWNEPHDKQNVKDEHEIIDEDHSPRSCHKRSYVDLDDYDSLDDNYEDSNYSAEDNFEERPKPKQRKGDFDALDEVQCYLCGFMSAFSHIHEHMDVLHKASSNYRYIQYGLKRDIQCHECKAMFETEKKLKNHLCCDGELPDRIDGKLPCADCGRDFAYNTDYWSHMKTVHSEKRDFKCEQCNFAAKLPILLARHVRKVHKSTPLDHICPECGKGFKVAYYLTAHLKLRHKKLLKDEEDGEKYKCSHCNRGFQSELSLKFHSKIHMKPGLSDSTINDELVCDQDDLKFDTTQDLNKHMVVDHNLSSTLNCDLCSEIWVSATVLEIHYTKDHGKQRFICDVCFKSFAIKGNMLRHQKQIHQGMERLDNKRRKNGCIKCGYEGPKMSNHWKLEHPGEELPIGCNECDYRTHSKDNLKSHVKAMHTAVVREKVQCDQCPYSTKSVHHLERHIRDIHLQIRAFKCEFCTKSFKNKRSLLAHSLSIHGVLLGDELQMKMIEKGLNAHKIQKEIEPTCQKCKKTGFSSVEALSEHVLNCYGKDLNARVEFKCPLCEKAWNSAEVLQYHHFKEHGLTVYVCHICGQCIKSKQYLERHINGVHYNKIEAECDICHKQFKDKYAIKLHKKIVHFKINPYKCDQCTYETRDNYRLQTHVLNKHTKSPEFKCRYCDFVTHVGKRYRNHVTNIHGPMKNKPKIVLSS